MKNLPEDAKIMKNVWKARTEIWEDEVKNVLNSAVTWDFDVNNMIWVWLSDGTTRLLCPLWKQGKLLDLSLKAVRPWANSVATSVIKANS